ncbi:MAG: hypothetical protein UIH99_04745 [Alphaproteobacteria bacterium]|nr:hypothetical protein [Alphaproteobacteria bacterium]
MYINLQTIKKNHKDDFVHCAIAVLAHELHHALDYQHPNQTALGAKNQDTTLNIDYTIPADKEAYLSSVREISSYKIQQDIFNELKQRDF